MAFFLAIVGPGLITAFGDNDAGGITTNSMVGAHYGYSFLWILLVVTIGLTVILEICARLGVITGKGLMDLIRENFGVQWAVLAVVALYVANLAATTANFAGIASSCELAGVSRYLVIPLISVFVWFLVTKGTYRRVERFLILLSLVLLSYIGAAVLAKPDWGLALKQVVVPSFKMESEYFYLIIATVGTTIAPWMIFFLQSMIVDKGINRRQLPWTRLEIWLSSFLTDFAISFFIIVASAAVFFPHGVRINDAKDAALALAPLAGHYASLLFGVGLFASSALALFLLPLTSAYVTCEAFGFENGLNRKVTEAPVFYGIMASFLIFGTVITLIPNVSLFPLIVAAQVIAGLVLPVILVFIILLINNRRLMGDYVNSPFYNLISYGVVGGTIISALVYVLLIVTGQAA